jgi:hypothetical protein
MASIYRSNNGTGPLRARVIKIEGDRVFMERTQSARGPFAVRFTLSLAFWKSPRNGWKLAALDEKGGTDAQG